MPKNKVKTEKVYKPVFMLVLKEKGSSIRKLGKEIPDTSDKTIRRQLKEGRMRPALLESIAKHLNVDPGVLSGKYIGNKEFMSFYPISHLDEFTYPRREVELYRSDTAFETVKHILALFNRSPSQFDALDIEKQYEFQKELFEAILPVIISFFKVDALGKNDEMETERILVELERWRDNHYMYEYAENTLRERFLSNPPDGYTKVQIKKMTPDELLYLDYELQDCEREHDRISKYDDYGIIN